MNFRYTVEMAKYSRPMVQLQILVLAFFLVAGFASLMPNVGMAQSASETATASATVWEPIVITENSAMNFGKILSPSAGQLTKFVLTCDTSPCSGNGATVTATLGDGGTLGQDGRIGRYHIAGEPGQELSITITLPPVCPTLSGGGILAVVKLVLGLPPLTNKDLTTEGDLDVTGPVSAGPYQCNYTITASYASS